MAAKFTKRDVAFFATWTDAELNAKFAEIGTWPDHKVKNGPFKGCVKIKFAKFSDLILNELRRRRETP